MHASLLGDSVCCKGARNHPGAHQCLDADRQIFGGQDKEKEDDLWYLCVDMSGCLLSAGVRRHGQCACTSFLDMSWLPSLSLSRLSNARPDGTYVRGLPLGMLDALSLTHLKESYFMIVLVTGLNIKKRLSPIGAMFGG